MLAMMIEKVTGETFIESRLESEEGEAREKKITIRLNTDDFHRIQERSLAEGFPNKTNWVTQLVLSTVDQAPVFTAEEVNAVRASNRELSAIGRNLNQIARQLNIEFRDSDRLTKDAIEKLSSKIDEHKTLVLTLLDKSQKRWDST
ncbi:MobC family plasmid mobilization relaxosome protein [Salmonella enterica]|nr:MobC family plasmid mobilization relaxosome protein [Salmonella enterica]